MTATATCSIVPDTSVTVTAASRGRNRIFPTIGPSPGAVSWAWAGRRQTTTGPQSRASSPSQTSPEGQRGQKRVVADSPAPARRVFVAVPGHARRRAVKVADGLCQVRNNDIGDLTIVEGDDELPTRTPTITAV
jgi:hypothetical protein